MKRPVAEILAELRSLEEHLHIEAKSGLGDSAIETVSAFSNEPGLGGGTILFGVAERDGQYEIIGVEHPERLTADLQSRVSDQTLNTPVRPTIWTERIDGRAVVACFVPEAPRIEKPIYARKLGLPRGAFRRIGNGDLRCSDDDVRRLHQLASERAFEDTVLPDASMGDLDPAVIASYRAALLEWNPASELRDLTNDQLVEALACARSTEGTLRPTVAGLLLFGTVRALLSFFPAARVDYIRIVGVEWVADPLYSVDVRQPLLLTFRKIYQAILEDLPKTAEVRADTGFRIDTPTVPARVLREALVNALCHRDYRVNSPTQVLRYSNRLEFRNAGHSLVPEDRFGQPGSDLRNPKIADVFRAMGLSESRGSGIRVMRREMEAAHLARPLFESSRADNKFIATLLFAHLLGDESRAWLSRLPVQGLSDAQVLALAYCRQVGEIRNSVLRDLTGLDTLAASAVLRDLRDRGLVVASGAGSQTHYVLGGIAASRPVAKTGEPPTQSGELENPRSPAQGGELTAQGGELATQGGELTAQGGELVNPAEREGLLADLPDALHARVRSLAKRASEAAVRALIIDLCTARPWSPTELSLVLGRSVRKLVDKHLTPLVREGLLERTHEALTHPDQAYRTPRGQP